MMITKIALYRYSVPFSTPFATSQQTFAERSGLILTAKSDTGLVALGEIAPLPGFSHESLDDCTTTALELAQQLNCQAIVTTPSELARLIERLGILQQSVSFGVELLLADLAAQAAGVSLSKWYREGALPSVSINAVLTGDQVAQQAATKLDSGYRTFKLKIGAHPIPSDFERIEAVRAAIGIDSTLRLDANRAYDLATARSLMNEINGSAVEYIEEPLKDPTLESLAGLRSDSGIPIAIDETLLEHARLTTAPRELVARLHEAHDVAILKPALMGSISRTLELAEALLRAGKKVVVTSSLDSGIGIAAALHIACALRLNAACGLDTGSGLTNQLVETPLTQSRGSIGTPDQPGLGVRLSRNSATRLLLRKLYEN